MLRRKKLLRKQKLNPKPHIKSKEDLYYEELISKCIQNVKIRSSNIKTKELARKEWLSKTFHKPSSELIEPNPEFYKGVSNKKSILELESVSHLDTKAINDKRKEHGISKPIEQAVVDSHKEILQKAKAVAVICPKSGYQYIGNCKQNLKDLGKKTQQYTEE